MMRELGPTSRSLLAAAREGLGPDAATAARVRAKLAVALGASAVEPASAGSGLALKLAAVLGIAALTVATSVVAHRHRPTASLPTWTVSAPSSEDDVRTVIRAAATESPSRAAPVPHKPPPARVVEPDIVVDEPPSLAREVELVDRAMLALRHGDTDDALAAMAIYDRETAGRGQLAQDAAAIAIDAHCRRGDAVTELLAAFDKRWPSSAQRTRLCAR
jgi:hypothetical protein